MTGVTAVSELVVDFVKSRGIWELAILKQGGIRIVLAELESEKARNLFMDIWTNSMCNAYEEGLLAVTGKEYEHAA